MPDIEFSTVATETVIDLTNDYFPLVDVSETPDAVNKVVPKVFRDAIFPGVLWANDYATLQDAFDALEASSTAKKLMLSGTYTVTATSTLDALVGKIVEGNGATIHMTTSATIFGIRFTGTWANSVVRNINFTSDGAGTHIGIVWDTAVNTTRVENCNFAGLFQGISCSGTTRAHIQNCDVTTCSNAGLLLGGEYCIVTGCNIHTNTAIGIQISGGNNTVTGNTIQYNAIGIEVDGAGNSDHGLISSNTINHQTKCGVYLNQLIYSMDVVGNEIWATNGANLGASPADSSFGIYVNDSPGVKIVGNTIARNKFGVGLNGISESIINGNHFLSDNLVTLRHVYEVGGTNATYLVDGNVFIDDLLTNSVVLATDVPGATLGTNLVI